MKGLFLILIFALFSCKTPQKTSSATKQQEQTTVVNRISLNTENGWEEITTQDIKRLINERYDVKIKQIKYDTDKPVDSLTNRHPIKEEIDIMIEASTETTESEQIVQDATGMEKTDFNDDSEMNLEVQNETTEKKQSGLNGLQKTLMILSGCLIVGIVIFIIIKVA